MGRIGLAFRAFFAALGGSLTAEKFELLADGTAGSSAEQQLAAPKTETKKAKKQEPVRSDALTLLASLQREARLVDLVQESLDGYSDQQVGAAARDVLRDSKKLLDRMFQLQPVVDQPDDSEFETPAEFSAARYRVTGSVQGDPPFKGRLVHPGWQATRCDLPQWSGGADEKDIVAPAEIEAG